MLSSYGGFVFAGQKDAILMGRRRPDTPLPLVIWAHYSAGTAMTTLLGGPRILLEGIADAGYCVIGHDLGVSPYKNWGNAEWQSRFSDVKTQAQATLPVASGDVIVVCSSMGTIGTLRRAGLTGDVKAVIGVLAVPSMAYIRSTGAAGLKADIETAWGISAAAALPANADPYDMLPALDGLPALFYTASDDTTAVGSKTAEFAGLIGAQAPIDIGPWGHTDAAIGHVPIDDTLDWLRDQ